MELLSAANAAFDVAGVELFAGVDLRLSTGDRVGLVGANGSGKSTLLRLLAGEVAPSSGGVRRAPGVRIGLLPQSDALLPGPTVANALHTATQRARELEADLRLLEQRMAADAADGAQYDAVLHEFERIGGYAAEARAREVVAALGLGDALEREVAHLSAGQRRRLALALTLTRAADVLLLDEPTNHLDLAAREWLARRLSAHDGAVVVISHDRALLDVATNRSAFLAGGRLWLERGAYSAARRRREAQQRASLKRSREQGREAERLERMAAELAAFGRKAAARKQRAERQSAALRALVATSDQRTRAPSPVLVPNQAGRKGGRVDTLVSVRHATMPGVLDDVAFTVGRDERIVLLGPNGSGKSSLVRLLAGDLSAAGPLTELNYLPGLKLRLVDQVNRGLELDGSLLAQVAAAVGSSKAPKLLAEAGVSPRAWDLLPEQASGGERARAGLALAFAQRADLWLLDEPTNDLDLEAVEAFEVQLTEALDASGAAVVLATHDRRLAERVGEVVWSVQDGQLVRYRDVAAYLRNEQLAAGPELPDGEETTTAPEPELADDELVTGLEDERVALLTLMADPLQLSERDSARLRRRVEAIEDELMEHYDARLPEALPRYRVVEHGLEVVGDLAGGHLELYLRALAPDGGRPPNAAAAGVVVALIGSVAHLRLREPAAACLLERPRSALVDAAARLAFTVLGAAAVQLQSAAPFSSRWLVGAGDDWHTAELDDFLKAEGWGPTRKRATQAGGKRRTGSRRRSGHVRR